MESNQLQSDRNAHDSKSRKITIAIECIDPFEGKRISYRTVRLKAKSPNVRKHLDDSERYGSHTALAGAHVEPNRKSACMPSPPA